jgi:hypothetical protein
MRLRGVQRRGIFLLLAFSASMAGCVSDGQKHAAITDVNDAFRREYEQILMEKGTRTYPVAQSQAFGALRKALARLGMRVADESPEIGYLNVSAPAPSPLDKKEWDAAAEQDLPKVREILGKHVGVLAYLFRFEPEGLDIVINATALRAGSGSEISLTMRMRETAPPKSGMPRREYPPPSAVRAGLDKIWSEIDRELGPGRGKP